MSFTQQEYQEFVAKARAQGFTEADIASYVAKSGGITNGTSLDKPTDITLDTEYTPPRGRVSSLPKFVAPGQPAPFDRDRYRTAMDLSQRLAVGKPESAVPTDAFGSIQKSQTGGFLGDTVGLGLRAVQRMVGVPVLGITETLGLTKPGETALAKKEYDERLVDYLAQNPGVGRFAAALLAEASAAMVPLLPGKPLGTAATKLAPKFMSYFGKELSAINAKRLSTYGPGLFAGGAEGAVIGVGETVDIENIPERLLRGSLYTAAGAAFGAAGTWSFIKAREKYGKPVDVPQRKYIKPGESKVPFMERFANHVWSLWDDKRQARALLKGLAKHQAIQSGTEFAPHGEFIDRLVQDVNVAHQSSHLPVNGAQGKIINIDDTLGGDTFEVRLAKFIGDNPDKINPALFDDFDAYADARSIIYIKEVYVPYLKDLRKTFMELKRSVKGGAARQDFAERIARIDDKLRAITPAEAHYKDSLETWGRLAEEYGEIHDSNKRSVGLIDEGLPELGRDRFNRIAVLTDLHELYLDFRQEALLDQLVTLGIHSKKDVAAYLLAHPYYSPQVRSLKDLNRKGIKDDFVLRLLEDIGDEVTFENPRTQTYAPRERWWTWREKGDEILPPSIAMMDGVTRAQPFFHAQRLRNHLYKMVKEHPEFAAEMGVEIIPPAEAQRMTNIATRKDLIRAYDPARPGEPIWMRAPERIAREFEQFTFKEYTGLTKLSAMLTKVFRLGSTSTLEFGLRGLTRDLLHKGVYTGLYTGNMATTDIIKYPFRVARVIGEMIGNAMKGDPQFMNWWRGFKDSPAGHGTFIGGDKFDRGLTVLEISDDLASRQHPMIQSMAKYFSELSSEVHPRTGLPQTLQSNIAHSLAKTAKRHRRAGLNPVKHVREVYRTLQDFVHQLEMLPRAITDYEIRKAGGSPNLAKVGGSEITVNFPLGGDLGKRINRHYAFFGAMQGDIRQFTYAMKDPKSRAHVLKALGAYLTLPTLAVEAKWHDDPEYQGLKEWEKVLFLHPFKLPNGRFVRIPLPPGILSTFFSYLPRKVLQAALTDSPSPGAVKNVIDQMVGNTPLKFIPTGLDEDSFKEWIVEASPTAVKPFAVIAVNRDPFFDRPIITEKLNRLPPEMRETIYSTGAAKGTAFLLNQFGLDVAPVTIDSLIGGYGGSLGRQLSELTGINADMEHAKVPNPFWRTPGIRGFLSTSPVGFGSQPVRDFYTLGHKANQAEQLFKLQTDPVRKRNVLIEHPEAAIASHWRKQKRKLDNAARAREVIVRNTTLTREEKYMRLMRIDSAVTQSVGVQMENYWESIQRFKVVMKAVEERAK